MSVVSHDSVIYTALTLQAGLSAQYITNQMNKNRLNHRFSTREPTRG